MEQISTNSFVRSSASRSCKFVPGPGSNKAKEDYVQYVQIEMPPAEKPGSVDVSVINADGGVATVPSGFTYTEVGTY